MRGQCFLCRDQLFESKVKFSLGQKHKDEDDKCFLHVLFFRLSAHFTTCSYLNRINVVLFWKEVGETAAADSPGSAPDPGGESYSSDRVPRGTDPTGAPRLNFQICTIVLEGYFQRWCELFQSIDFISNKGVGSPPFCHSRAVGGQFSFLEFSGVGLQQKYAQTLLLCA